MMIGSEGALVKKNYHTPFSPSWESYRWENTCGLLAEIFFLIFTPEVAGNGKVATTLELPLQAGIAILTLQLFAEAAAKNHHGEKSQHRGARKAIFNKLGEKLMPSQIAEFQSRKAC